MGYYNHTEHIILKTHCVLPLNQNGLIYTITPCSELPYFPARKTHRDFFVGNFRKKC